MRIGASEGIVLEVVAEKDGKPLPFQELLRRFRRIHDVMAATEEIPLKLYLFDLLYLNGETLLDELYRKRTEFLSEFAGSFMVKRIITDEKEETRHFLEEAISAGHEGVMVKELDSPYIPGKREKTWKKIKPTETLDLLIIAAEWGHGRRKNWLSNYHLATRKGHMLGKPSRGPRTPSSRSSRRRCWS